MSHSDDLQSIDAQLDTLRLRISDLSRQIDANKTMTAAALAGGVFFLLLAGGAAYDLFVGKEGLWLARGVTPETLRWIARGLGAAGLLLLAIAIVRVKRHDKGLDARLDQLEHQYAALLDRRDDTALNIGEGGR